VTNLTDLSARFVNLPPSEVDQEIEEGLRQIVEALDVDRATLMESSGDGQGLIFTDPWARDDVFRKRPSVPRSTMLGEIQHVGVMC
jgi:hypothetical protein